MVEQRSISEPARQTKLFGEFEVVVLGGGPAGIAAATAAAKSGRATLLVERYGFLGGAGTAADVTNFCGLYASSHGEFHQVVHGLADEVLDRIDALGGLNAPHRTLGGRVQARCYDTAAYKIAADAMLLEAGVKILFHALAVGVVMGHETAIDALVVETKSGRLAIRSALFIDCSGDADLAAWAGAPFELGDGHGGMAYPSTMFRINNVDRVRAEGMSEKMGALLDEAAEARGRPYPRRTPIVRPQRRGIEWRANMTQVRNPDGSAVDGTDAVQLSYGEIEGRRQVLETFTFLQQNVPGFEDSYIVEIAAQLGIRQTRRVLGPYLLTQEDVLGCADFPDTIGANGWPIEAHVAGDVKLLFAPEHSRGFNALPYRMLLPQIVSNLLVAGRCASMTHEGQSAARVSGPCFAMGQAAGTAADLALAGNGAPADLDVAALQARLERDGAFLGRGT